MAVSALMIPPLDTDTSEVVSRPTPAVNTQPGWNLAWVRTLPRELPLRTIGSKSDVIALFAVVISAVFAVAVMHDVPDPN